MIGIGGFIEIQCMASRTIRRSTGITGGVAIQALGRQVRARKRKARQVVIKTIPDAAHGVARQTGIAFEHVATYPRMPIIGSGIGVAGCTSERCKIRRIRVAVHASAPLPLVGTAVDGKELGIVRQKLRRHPVGVGGMAGSAIGGHPGIQVIGLLGRFKVGLVASETIGRGMGKITVGMTTGTVSQVVPQGKRKKVVIDLIGMPIGGKHIMAFQAVGTEACLRVIGIGGSREIGGVTADTIIAVAIKPQCCFCHMAVYTIGVGVYARKWKAVCLVKFRHIIHQPIIRSMTAGTIVPHRHLVHIGMAGDAIGFGLVKNEGRVAIPAIDYCVVAC